jgi:hypothetical protein
MKKMHLLSVFLLIFISCSKEDSDNSKPTIYITGSEVTDDYRKMAYWKNGIPTIINLPNDDDGIFTDIYVEGNDVYNIGSQGRSFYNSVFYKNNVEVTTDLTSIYQEIKSLVVNNSAVYLAYTSYNSGLTKPYLWENEQKTFLNEGSLIADKTSRMNAMEVLDNKTHIVGWTEINNKNYALYWKDKKPYLLSESNLKEGIATDICVSGQDIYIVGYRSNSTSVIWKNEQEILVIDEANPIQFNAIAVSGNDVYVAGVELISSTYRKAKLWKNGIAQDLNGDYQYIDVKDLAVVGNDVYVIASSADNNGANNKGHVWKNGTEDIELSKTNANFQSIFITK